MEYVCPARHAYHCLLSDHICLDSFSYKGGLDQSPLSYYKLNNRQHLLLKAVTRDTDPLVLFR